MKKNAKRNVTILLALAAAALVAGCETKPQTPYVPPLDPDRKVSEQDCSRPLDTGGGNLKCREVSEAELRARMAEEERQARARKEAAERAERERLEALARAERERLERERAAQLAREEAARKAREAEEARLAAERRRLEEEAARKAQEERERQEKAEAELRARQAAELAAREAAERERQRLEHEWLAGRAMLENFIATYGNVAKFKSVSGQINTFLDKTR